MTTERWSRWCDWRALVPAAALALSFAAPAAAEETIIYFHQDALGSVRLVTGRGGEVLARHDYLPFGEEIPAGQLVSASEATPANDVFGPGAGGHRSAGLVGATHASPLPEGREGHGGRVVVRSER